MYSSILTLMPSPRLDVNWHLRVHTTRERTLFFRGHSFFNSGSTSSDRLALAVARVNGTKSTSCVLRTQVNVPISRHCHSPSEHRHPMRSAYRWTTVYFLISFSHPRHFIPHRDEEARRTWRNRIIEPRRTKKHRTRQHPSVVKHIGVKSKFSHATPSFFDLFHST